MRLALSGGYCSAGDLGDLLFSHLTPSSALQSLKVVVHRLRRKLEWPGILRVSSGGYGLHSSVKCDLVSAESEIRRALMEQKPLANERRERCIAFLQRLRANNVEAFLRWDWFCELDRRRNRLRRDVALALAYDARASGNIEDALHYASEMSRWDPIDEAPREIAIRAYIDGGDLALAKREYDDYAGALRVELDAEPSNDVRALIAFIGAAE
jgi:DNA-binding SARP family transcriptional activator